MVSRTIRIAAFAAVASLVVAGCEKRQDGGTAVKDDAPAVESPTPPADAGSPQGETDVFADERAEMVAKQLAARDVSDEKVLEAMREVPRHEFTLPKFQADAYSDSPLPIGHGQTISQPYIVGKMTQELRPEPGDKVLEIGTGSGYQAAVLSNLVDHVYTIEILCPLAEDAKEDLKRTGYDDNVTVKCGDGYAGWPEHAPFDKIIVTAAPPEVPEALVEQLAPGGRMLIPVGDLYQELRVIEKTSDGEMKSETLLPVRFVPMVKGKDAGTE